MPADLLTSTEACERLGIRSQTLYAYVSRGLLTPTKDGRRSLFRRAQVDALAQRTARGRRPGRFEISIETAITLLDPAGRLLYRGADAIGLAGAWSYERVAGWLCTGTDAGEPRAPWEADASALDAARAVQAALPTAATPAERVRVTIAAIGAAQREPMGAATLIATTVDALPPRGASAGTSIAARLWRGLTSLRATPERVRALETALVLLADHELASSTLAARVAASTHARTSETVLAGLATLSGPLHGGASSGARVLLADAERRGARAAVDRVLAGGRRIPGVGHAVYKREDPRAGPILDRVRAIASPSTVAAIDSLVAEIGRRTPLPVNSDLSLGALAHATRMTKGAGEAIFAVARIAGWIAHVEEERAHRMRFRPRAIYIGPRD